MSDVDTRTAVVEMIAAAEEREARWEDVARGVGDADHAQWCQERRVISMVLRALAAERDALAAALREARDGLRYWEPQTSKGAQECARICAMVEAAIAKIGGRANG